MNAEFWRALPPEVIVVATVLLFVLSVALLWEGIQRIRSQAAVTRELKRVVAQREGAVGGEPPAGAESLLRERATSRFPWLERMVELLPRRADLQHLMEQADVSWSVGTLLVAVLALAAVAGLAATLFAGVSSWVLLAAAAVGGSLPFLWLRRRRSRRFAAFEEAFPDAIDLLSRSVRAGNAFSAGIRAIAEEAVEPVASEFRQVFEEQKFGMPLKESLLALADRMALVDVRIFVTSVLIQRESGGNLVENLENLSSTIRERFKFRRQVKVYTAQGRMTGLVLAVVPVAAAVGLWLLNPEYMGKLFTEPTGQKMLIAAAGLQAVGYLVIRRLVRLEV